ncbi:MAG: glutamine synthetase, partial [Sciscionella sp.]
MDVDEQRRRALGAEAMRLRTELVARGVRMVAVTFVDNSGITRVKAVPLEKLEAAAAWGIGASPCFDAFLFNDVGVACRLEVVGDLRLHPDLGRLTALAAQPGWAWAPADRYALDGGVHPQDQRSLARSATRLLTDAGYTARCAFEVEWALGRADAPNGDFVPAVTGPAYGAARLVERSDYLADVAVALGEQGVGVEQVHPEYGAGQFELSVASE